MWYGQDRFPSKLIHKIFFVLTLSVALPLCIISKNSLLFRLCLWLSWVAQNSINLVSSSLKIKILFEDHSDSVSRWGSYFLIHFLRFFGFECLCWVESSRYCKESQVAFSAKSIMHKLKRAWPKMLPYAIPKFDGWTFIINLNKLLSFWDIALN